MPAGYDLKEGYYVERPLSDDEMWSVFLLNETEFEVIECGITSDIRPGRADEKWVNVISKRSNSL